MSGASNKQGRKIVGLPEMSDPLYDLPSDQRKNPPSQIMTAASSSPPSGHKEQQQSSTAVDLPPDDFGDVVVAPEPDLEDSFTAAIRMAFVGAGQGGGRLAEAFSKLGYRRVCCVNTTEQDLASLEVPNKLVIGNNRGGAGKDPEEGKLAAKESFEDIMDLLLRSWGENVEQCYILVGSGGGSGSGSWPVLVEAVREYCKSTNVEKPLHKHIGVIMTMPKRSEGSRVQKNAHAALKQAIDYLNAGKICSLVIVDNAKIHELFPRLPVKRFWDVANRNFVAVLHTFNLLAAQNSQFNTYDKQDFRNTVRNGLMIFGMTKVDRWSQKEDISQAMRQNLKNTILADGFDLSKANTAGAIIVAHDSILSEIPMENLDYAFHALGRTLGNEGITLHNGIYEGVQTGMRVFTIISGLEPPQARLDEMEQLSR